MRNRFIIDFTGRDVVKLFVKLYLAKFVVDVAMAAVTPFIQESTQKMRREREFRKNNIEYPQPIFIHPEED